MMKNIFNIILVAVAAFGVTACSDDDNEGRYSNPSSVQVATADVLFEARASEGTITFTAPSSVTVTSSADWCTTRLDGSTIFVKAETNDRVEGRSAKITIKCGADSANVVVIQKGVIFRFANDANAFAAKSNEAQTVEVNFTANVDVELSSESEWIRPHLSETEDGVLLIDVDANTTGHVRRGSFTCKAGGFAFEVPFTQYDFDQNFAGNATFFYTASQTAGSRETSAATTITKTDITVDGYKIPVVFDETSCRFYIYAGNKVGTYNDRNTTYDVVTTITDGDYITWSNTISLTGEVAWNEETQKTDIRFVDNGSFSGRTALGFSLYLFSGEPSSSTAYSGLHSYFNVRLEK